MFDVGPRGYILKAKAQLLLYAKGEGKCVGKMLTVFIAITVDAAIVGVPAITCGMWSEQGEFVSEGVQQSP